MSLLKQILTLVTLGIFVCGCGKFESRDAETLPPVPELQSQKETETQFPDDSCTITSGDVFAPLGGTDFSEYRIRVGKTVMPSIYFDPIAAGKIIGEMKKGGGACTLPSQCSIVRLKGESIKNKLLPGNYNLKVANFIFEGRNSSYGDPIKAGQDLGRLVSYGVCQSGLTCSIVPTPSDALLVGYNIKIGDTIIDGSMSLYTDLIKPAKDIGILRSAGVCK